MGTRTSPYLQEKLALLGCEQVFARVPELVQSLLGIEVNQAQTYRVCQAISLAIDEHQLHSPSPALAQQAGQAKALIYGMVDGSMLLTDTGWQETKLGRVFAAQDHRASPFRATIVRSEYVGHRGSCQDFTPAFEQLLPPDSPAQKVFVTDGAEWIGNWLRATYPTATHILDYFHVVEKLAALARELPNGQVWLAAQQEALLADQSQQVEDNVLALSQLSLTERTSVVGYLMKNRERMRYKTYQEQGLLIGSGPIEAAHKAVLQVRMKRSGQRWADRGCDNMVRLRVAHHSGKFSLVTDLLKARQAKN